ncbi:MAG: RNA methyltransferase [Prolixibacteraceae bacterium]|nr:RNA methyltransferase [Prolixibacteraceae bacterium]
MLSKAKIKLINSLTYKKYRDSTGLFIAEGEKLTRELAMARFSFNLLIATEGLMPYYDSVGCEKIVATPEQFKQISQFKHPSNVLALCYQKRLKPDISGLKNELSLVLDQIQDPGNLGTIIRLSSWFGLRHLICSTDTADCYNPKAVQASMGALAHVDIHYTNLKTFLNDAKEAGIPVYGTFITGKNIYNEKLDSNGLVVLGNEGKGISHEIEGLIDNKLSIPSNNFNRLSVESLNVSVAAAIVCSEFRREFLS